MKFIVIKQFSNVMNYELNISVSFNKPTSQNGIFFKDTSGSGLAVDGNNNSCAKIIAKKGEFAWWRVFLEEDYYIDKVVINFKPNSSGWLLLS